MAKARLEINARELQRELIAALSVELSKTIRKRKHRIEQRIGDAIRKAIEASPEYVQLTNAGSQLIKELGIPDAASKIRKLVDAWANDVQVKIGTPHASARKLSLSITIQGAGKVDMSDVLQLPESSYVTDKGQTLNWVKWLVLEGDKRIIIGYNFSLPNRFEQRLSRVGGWMRANQTGRWGVPPEYAGTQGNNFITRSLKGIENDITRIVQDELSK